MLDMSDCKPADEPAGDVVALPTRQKNALCLLLDKPRFTPEEVAAIDYRVLERAPGVGKNSIAIIGAWLNSQGYELKGVPTAPVNRREVQRQRKLERAIDYLQWHGYEVRRSN